jgi:hypothetical protein
VIAFKREREIDLAALAARAAQIVADTKLPAKSWVKGISGEISLKGGRTMTQLDLQQIYTGCWPTA